MMEVLLNKRVVAHISRQDPKAERYSADEPWILHRVGGGRIDRFPTQSEAVGEARKTWGDVLLRRLPAKKVGYDLVQIAKELEQTALNHAYYGNALRVAKDIPGLSTDEIQVLDRYATGLQRSSDHVALQGIAVYLRERAIEEAQTDSESRGVDDTARPMPRPKG